MYVSDVPGLTQPHRNAIIHGEWLWPTRGQEHELAAARAWSSRRGRSGHDVHAIARRYRPGDHRLGGTTALLASVARRRAQA
jgi:hypothetical protein